MQFYKVKLNKVECLNFIATKEVLFHIVDIVKEVIRKEKKTP